ncbi:Cmx/CmrA family chloramphenicol efflux MFS transporter [Nocardia transvalensis]|uniref:Cmx/CmrA family chloramphenicol efflux MFS transporter n=1 Tax=Nocardia transvalensis TaxID=37333 RepID=UPI00189517CD|nr:Cmx/CmrA family chloramphenicol efflux MFS transporter [Nocardia transvalensis]MBF6330422.1 MFS transporter [Nocardia transvalensis]
MPVVVFVLAAAVFAQGTSEFMFSGLLAPIAADIGVSIGAAGLLTSLFALGMIIGAPLMAMTAGRWSTRRALAGFLLAFLAAHVIGACTTSFAILLITRAVAAIANAGFLAVTLAALPALVGNARVGRATSSVLAGVTLACIVGVPAGTLLGQIWGWQSALWAVVVVGLPALAATWRLVPPTGSPGGAESALDPLRHEWRALGDRAVRTVLCCGALVNGATFAAFTYLGVLVTDAGHAAPQWIPVALALFGIGSFLGVTAAGRYADRYAHPIVTVGAGALVPVWVATACAARWLPSLLAMTLVAGVVSFAVGSTVIGLIVRTAAATAPRLGGAMATTAFNVGAAVGPAAAGLAIGAAGAATAAVWISAVLSSVAAVTILLARRRQRREVHDGTDRPVDNTVRAGYEN